MEIQNKIKMLSRLPSSFIKSIFCSKPKVLTDKETISMIRDKKVSISRFGDGEMNLMLGQGIVFQEADSLLKDRLKRIARDPIDKLLVCVPNIFRNDLKNRLTPDAYKWWRKYLFFTRGYWYSWFKHDLFGDTQISRFYMDSADKRERSVYVNILKDVFRDRDILFVEGKNSRLGVGNDLFSFAKSIRRILCPEKNAFFYYDEILKKTLQHVQNTDLIICALGPTATVLSYDLTQANLQSLDLGHIDAEYEWFISGVETKTPLLYKDMNEINGDHAVMALEDSAYKQQIIDRV